MDTIMLRMTLVKSARKAGGDRYECKFEGDDIVFYIPQSISRKGGVPSPKLLIEIKGDE
jgi:hypothetical protein